jgi:hypothetical protein
VATRPVKQAVISASALSLLYPPDGINGYAQEEFLADLVDEAQVDIRGCLDAGAHNVQIDFTPGRLALKLDPSGGLLRQRSTSHSPASPIRSRCCRRYAQACAPASVSSSALPTPSTR